MAGSGETLTYGNLEKRANQGAHFFRSLGLQAGDTVAYWLPNTLIIFEFYWAAQRAGLYITPISSRLTASEAAYIIGDCKARLLLMDPHLEGAADFMAKERGHLPALGTLLFHGCDRQPSWAVIQAYDDQPIADETAGYHMVYSSGTTGRPKGIRLPLTGGPATQAHMLAEKQREAGTAKADTIYLSPAPLYHTAPLAFCTVMHRLGATCIILPKFEAETALAAIEQYRVTYVQMVPTMFLRWLKLPNERRTRYDLSSLQRVVHAAAPCPIPVKEQMIDWLGPIIYEYYGGSEGNGSTSITSEEWLRKKGSVGKADWGMLHICDDEGRELPVGEAGTVYFEGGWDFQYLNDPEKSREARHPQHPTWTTLGDVGYMDSDGYLFLTDRKSFMIISGGVNIYPQETENLLILHPKVADVAVIGVPHGDMGEEVKAVVQLHDPADATPATAQELIQYCRQHLSAIKCPKSVDFDPALPRHETGKLYKKLVKDRYWS